MGRSSLTESVVAAGAVHGLRSRRHGAALPGFYLGYSVSPDHWNHGVASAATGLVVAALHGAGIRRIVAKTFAENAASIRVLTKNGFALEATERRAVLGRDGRWLDACTLAHLAP